MMVPGLALPRRVEGWKRPVLPLRREIVRRRSYAAPRHKIVAVGPKLRAETVGGQRQVMIQADGELLVARVLLCGGELKVDLPLPILVKQDGAPVFSPKGFGFSRLRIAKCLRPVRPQPNFRVAPVDPLIQRAIRGKAPQQFSLALDVLLKLESSGRAAPVIAAQECGKNPLQELQLQCADTFVFDKLRRPQRLDFPLCGGVGEQPLRTRAPG